MDASSTLTVPGRYGSLAAIHDFFARAAEAAGLDDRAVYAVQVAVDEACANIIEHAYGGEGDDPIECSWHISDDALTMVLRDHGQAFDPSHVAEPDLGAGLHERDSGGLGVYFIQQLMDRVSFEPDPDSGNTLTMVKRRETTT